jgi:hypothetical protein
MSIRRSFSKIQKRFQIYVIIIDRRPLKRNHVETEEKLVAISHQLDNMPRKCLQQLAQQSGASCGSMWTATKLLHIRPYIIAAVLEMKPVEY